MKNSKLFGVNLLDFLKGLILAVGTPLLYYLQELLPSLGMAEWQKIALSALIAYIIKQFFTSSEGKFMNKEGDIVDDEIIGNRPKDR